MSPRSLFPFALAALVALPVAPTLSQTSETFAQDSFSTGLDVPEIQAPQAAERLLLRLQEEVPVPGPLNRNGPRFRDGRVEVPVAAGLATFVPGGETEAEIGPHDYTDLPPLPWAESASGKRRYRTLPNGWLIAEKRCGRCETGWKRKWRLRVPGNTLSAPSLDSKRLYFGAMDNRIYAVKRRNGHRIWSTDVGGRTSQPLMPWSGFVGNPGNPAAARRIDLVMVVPDSGAELILLDGRSGQEVAEVRIRPGEGKLVGTPLTLPDNRIAVAYQRYQETEASVRIYRIDTPDAVAPTPPTPAEGEEAPAAEGEPRSP